MKQYSIDGSPAEAAAPSVLVISESDPSGASGIQGDLASLAALGLYGMAVPTALTVQDAHGVRAVHPLEPAVVTESIRALLGSMPVDAIKVGLLHSAAMSRAVNDALAGFSGPLVVDPVTDRLQRGSFEDEALHDLLLERWLPWTTVVTPNLNAATALCGVVVDDIEMMIAAARALKGLGPECVLLKGGGLAGDPVDALVDDTGMALLWGTRRQLPRTRGGGSAISIAVCAALARGLSPRSACIDARNRLDRALATDHPVGRGTRSISHRALR